RVPARATVSRRGADRFRHRRCLGPLPRAAARESVELFHLPRKLIMSHPRLSSVLVCAAVGAIFAAIGPAAHAAWPDKPIRIVVTFAAGGASDIVARTISDPLSRALGQPVIVDNKPGAGGTIGGLDVVRSPADGYTLMLSNSTPLSIGPYTVPKLPYDPVRQFTHVAMLGIAPVL